MFRNPSPVISSIMDSPSAWRLLFQQVEKASIGIGCREFRQESREVGGVPRFFRELAGRKASATFPP